MKPSRAALAPPCALLAALCALPLPVTHGASVPVAQQPAVVQSDPPAPQATPKPATRPAPNAPGDARAAGEARKKTPVALGSITGRIIGEGGEPMAGVSVYAVPRSSSTNVRTPRTSAADDEGSFRIEGLEPGVYNIFANLPGYTVEADPQTGRMGSLYRPGDTATVRLVKGGVVTGTVTDTQGEPLVAMSVRAHRVRDLDGGRPAPPGSTYAGEDKTDDRGVYRIYGLQPGVYVVLAGGFSPWNYGPGSAYDADAPTFYPSATRDTASEITVRSGQETAGIDVRYRDEQGHRVTGRIEVPAAAPDPNAAVGVTLNYSSTGINAGNTWIPLSADNRAFSLEGVADGDYDLQANGGGREGLTLSSAPQRVTVRGADVTGLVFKLAPLASVSGTLVIEPPSDADRARAVCKDRRASLAPQETLVMLLADRPAAAKNQPAGRTSPIRDAAPDAAGAFTLPSLEAGRYRFSVRPLDENLFVRSIQLPGATAATAAQRAAGPPPAQRTSAEPPPKASASDALDVRPGQQLSGIAVRLSEGASVLSGHIVATEGAAPPPFAQLRVHLLPAERERADDALRFFETTPAPDGSFTFKSLPPGRYLVLARVAPDASEAAPRRAVWDADSRAKLRREAEAAAAPVELQPCQRATDFALRFPPPSK